MVVTTLFQPPRARLYRTEWIEHDRIVMLRKPFHRKTRMAPENRHPLRAVPPVPPWQVSCPFSTSGCRDFRRLATRGMQRMQRDHPKTDVPLPESGFKNQSNKLDGQWELAHWHIVGVGWNDSLRFCQAKQLNVLVRYPKNAPPVTSKILKAML